MPTGTEGSFKDITSQRYGRLVAQWPIGKNKDNRVVWLCLCDCGSIKGINECSLSRGNSKSCGCLQKEEVGKRFTVSSFKHGKSRTIEGSLLYSAADRARKANPPLDFNITMDDIVIPEKCPLLEIPINKTRGRGHNPDSPSLDRLNNNLGYVKGNVHIISTRANALKGDASLDEMKKLVRNWEKLL